MIRSLAAAVLLSGAGAMASEPVVISGYGVSLARPSTPAGG